MRTERSKGSVTPFPKFRQPVIDSLRQAKNMSVVHMITEVDITVARRKVREFRKRESRPLSFTAYLTACVARAVNEYKSLHAYRRGNKLVIFEDVDIAVIVERRMTDGNAPIYPHVIKAADKKTVEVIDDEISAAQRERVDSPERMRWIRLYWILPGFVRRLMWRVLLNSPRWRKRLTGTVGISAIGMFGNGPAWGIPLPTYTLNVTVGGISRKPGLAGGRLESREYLCVTLSFDHNIVDGAPAARFGQRLRELIERGGPLDGWTVGQ